jgi:restriction system protein
MRRRGIYEPVADILQLTPAQREEWLPSGKHLRYRHRLGWSLSMLKAAEYADAPSVGVWCITEEGRKLLASHPQQFSDAIMRSIVRKARAANHGTSEGLLPDQAVSAIQQAPEERIDSAVKEIEEAVARELLERISQAPPVFFEDLVLRLLHALGYGTSEADLQRTGGSGDAGIDGIISLDKLGFEKVYVQAKRWQGSVGRPEIQSFFGALAGRRAKKGVFITTSSFTPDARHYGNQVSENIVLIDGARLTSLMIEYGVGVTHHRVIRLPRVDGDYFE